MGLVSPVTLHVDRPDIFPMFMFMPAVADEPMRRETANRRIGTCEMRHAHDKPSAQRNHELSTRVLRAKSRVRGLYVGLVTFS
jgi:hypothetical protein